MKKTKSKDDTHDVMRAFAAQIGAMLDTEERGRLPVEEFNTLVARLAAAPDQASGDAIRQLIIDGFYGPRKKRRAREMVA